MKLGFSNQIGYLLDYKLELYKFYFVDDCSTSCCVITFQLGKTRDHAISIIDHGSWIFGNDYLIMIIARLDCGPMRTRIFVT